MEQVVDLATRKCGSIAVALVWDRSDQTLRVLRTTDRPARRSSCRSAATRRKRSIGIRSPTPPARSGRSARQESEMASWDSPDRPGREKNRSPLPGLRSTSGRGPRCRGLPPVPRLPGVERRFEESAHASARGSESQRRRESLPPLAALLARPLSVNGRGIGRSRVRGRARAGKSKDLRADTLAQQRS